MLEGSKSITLADVWSKMFFQARAILRIHEESSFTSVWLVSILNDQCNSQPLSKIFNASGGMAKTWTELGTHMIYIRYNREAHRAVLSEQQRGTRKLGQSSHTA